MSRSKIEKSRDPVDPATLKHALEPADKKHSFREAANVCGVSRMTLSRHAQKLSVVQKTKYCANYAVENFFSVSEEEYLVEYIQTVAKIQHGLLKKGVRLLAYKIVKANNKKYPETWDGEQVA